MLDNDINNTNEEGSEDKLQNSEVNPNKNTEELEKEWADALHFDKWPPEPVQTQTPPRIPEEALNQQTPVNQAPPQAPEPYIPNTPETFGGQSPAASIELADAQPEMPSTYLVWSVIAAVLCCMIPGIVAIVYSTKVSSRYFARDYEGAKKASEMAQYWIIGSIVLGLILNTIYFPLMLVSGL